MTLSSQGLLYFVAPLGFEPRQTEPESVVLPLHNRAIVLLRCKDSSFLGFQKTTIYFFISLQYFLILVVISQHFQCLGYMFVFTNMIFQHTFLHIITLHKLIGQYIGNLILKRIQIPIY